MKILSILVIFLFSACDKSTPPKDDKTILKEKSEKYFKLAKMSLFTQSHGVEFDQLGEDIQSKLQNRECYYYVEGKRKVCDFKNMEYLKVILNNESAKIINFYESCGDQGERRPCSKEEYIEKSKNFRMKDLFSPKNSNIVFYDRNGLIPVSGDDVFVDIIDFKEGKENTMFLLGGRLKSRGFTYLFTNSWGVEVGPF